MSTAQEIEILIRARYPILNILTWEEERVDRDIEEIARGRNKKSYGWTITRGIHPLGSAPSSRPASGRDPLAALEEVIQMVDPAIFVFKDFHPFLTDPAVVRKLRETAAHLKTSYKTLVLLSPVMRLPVELEKDVTVIDYALPDRAEIGKLLDSMVEEVRGKSELKIDLTADFRETILRASTGMTLKECENVFAKTLVARGGMSASDVEFVFSEKKQIIRKSGLLEYYEATESMDNIGGLDALKIWFGKRVAAFGDRARNFGLPPPRGILLIGVQGCGKSLCAKAISSLWRMPLLRMDVGKLFNSLVGSSEENIRRAITVAESVSPAVLWVDEIEKAFAGSDSSGSSDAGTASRVLGTFLTWLQEKTKPVFVVATANNISRLPPELLRKGRLDEIFFVDLPREDERRHIWAIHLYKRNRDYQTFDLNRLAEASDGFSGAEIEEAVISSLYDVFDAQSDLTTDSLLQAVRATVPLSRTMAEGISEIREWADGRARRATSEEPLPAPGRSRTLEIH